MRTLNNSELKSVVGGVVAGDDPHGKTSRPTYRPGETFAEYQQRLKDYMIQNGMM